MNTKNIIDRLDNFFNNEYKSASKISIIQNNDGSYVLFDKYMIQKFNNTYKVFKLATHVELDFNVLQNSVTWCIFDYRNKIIDCNKIVTLDRDLSSIDASIQLHKTLIGKTKNQDNKILYYAKMSNDICKKKNYTRQLKMLVREATNWQLNRFNYKEQF
jgi:hypothetical protein